MWRLIRARESEREPYIISRSRRFKVKKWNAVAVWSWNVLTDTCAICRNNLHEPSIEYQAQVRATPFNPRFHLSPADH